MKLNKDQRDGLAKISDNIATVLVLASILGWWAEGRIGFPAALGLTVVSTIFIVCGVLFRKGNR
ncbi:MAG: hypothetical protein EBR85_03660 [Betaproteobacteria bacterium]|nr:hypothetical protein [Betaproteobacteria bacterium]